MSQVIPEKPLRVVVWSTGTIGRHAIAGVDAHPDLELVGVWVSNPDKHGKDAGLLAELGRELGVPATTDRDELVALAPDAVVVATHPHQALALLAEPTAAHREVLGAMPYSPNTALLHTDTSLMPRLTQTWASWNFMRPGAAQERPDGSDGVVVTYDLTRLQRLSTDTHYLVTLGGEHLVDPSTVIDRMEYEHPLYTPESVAAQRRLPELDTDRVAFAGAYHGWGFHEDGARSGLAAVERLGLTWPEPVVEQQGAPATSGRRDLATPRCTSAPCGCVES